jgi:hypothetical protein
MGTACGMYWGEEIYTHRALMGKPERNRPLERPGYIYIIYIYIYVYELLILN